MRLTSSLYASPDDVIALELILVLKYLRNPFVRAMADFDSSAPSQRTLRGHLAMVIDRWGFIGLTHCGDRNQWIAAYDSE